MQFEYRYASDSVVESDASSTQIAFAPDTRRPPTFFRGELAQAINFREAIGALHDVVISDFRWHPKERPEYQQWLERREAEDAIAVAAQQAEVARQIEEKRRELEELRERHRARFQEFSLAQRRYFQHLYDRDRNAWWILDPVITVHPDEVFFECFSRDESSYGRLSVDYNVFQKIGEFSCGTTNIDYSDALYDEFQKIRSYKSTTFEVDGSGFEVQTTGEATHREVKIDLPDSWVRGFLQVSSAMSLPAVRCDLHPMDVHNICFHLRRKKEVVGPRSLRYRLTPGGPLTVVIDPWGIELPCPRSVCHCDEPQELRVWGRRRLHILERLIPQARSFSLYLLGYGMPSFYLADLGAMTFTLGLSGWVANDWSGAGNFDLLTPRSQVDAATAQRVFDELKQQWQATPEALAERLGLERSVVLSALGGYTQAGRAIWDLNKQVYRARELSRDPLPLGELRFSSEREAQAFELLDQGHVQLAREAAGDRDRVEVSGAAQEKGRNYAVSLQVDSDLRVVGASCECNFHRQNRLRRGPCRHILALRMIHQRRHRGQPARAT